MLWLKGKWVLMLIAKYVGKLTTTSQPLLSLMAALSLDLDYVSLVVHMIELFKLDKKIDTQQNQISHIF